MTEATNATPQPLPMASTGCSCCAPAARGTNQTAEPRGSAAVPASNTYPVEGMTCSHCAGRVSEALTALDDVDDVRVELVPGAASTVTVIGTASPQAVQAAVEQAGYLVAEA